MLNAKIIANVNNKGKTQFTSKIIRNIGILKANCLLLWMTMNMVLQRHVSSPQVWVVAQIFYDTLRPMVNQCIVNQKMKLLVDI